MNNKDEYEKSMGSRGFLICDKCGIAKTKMTKRTINLEDLEICNKCYAKIK